VRRTTIGHESAARPADQVQREFRATRPDQLSVIDLTYLRTWAGFGYLALVVDVFSRRIVGWALTAHMRTELALEALEMAIWAGLRTCFRDGRLPPPRSSWGKGTGLLIRGLVDDKERCRLCVQSVCSLHGSAGDAGPAFWTDFLDN